MGTDEGERVVLPSTQETQELGDYPSLFHSGAVKYIGIDVSSMLSKIVP